MVLCLTFFLQDVVIHILIHYAIDKVYVAYSSGRYTPPNHYICIIVSSINFLHTFVIPSESNRLIFVSSDQITSFQKFLILIQMFFCKSNPIFTVSSTHGRSFFGLLDHESHSHATHGELFGYT